MLPARRQRIRAVFVILADKDAQIAAVVVGILALVVVALIALVGADRRGIGDAVMHGVVIFGAAVARAKEDADDACVGKIGDMPQDVFGAVILGVPVAVIFGVEVLIAFGHLPHDHMPPAVRRERANKLEVAREVGEDLVGAVPPVAGLAGVVVGNIIGNQVPMRDACWRAGDARRKQEMCFTLSQTRDIQVGVG